MTGGPGSTTGVQPACQRRAIVHRVPANSRNADTSTTGGFRRPAVSSRRIRRCSQAFEDGVKRCLLGPEKAMTVVHEDLALRGQLERPAHARNQADTDPPLKAADRAAETRLAHMKPRGGASVMPLFGKHEQAADGP